MTQPDHADTPPNFDEIIDRRGTGSYKWDEMAAKYGVDPADGISMWVADMDFRPPASVQRAVERIAATGVYGYPAVGPGYHRAITGWMARRFGWEVAPEWISSTHGLVNAVGLIIAEFSAPGDAIALMTPVYHAFARVVAAADRDLTALPLQIDEDGLYRFDTAEWEATLTGRERVFLLSSPHNPGGRVWSRDELHEIAAFCATHKMLLVSDEIHHDLVLPGAPAHTPMALVDGAEDLITLVSTTKTFNIAGAHLGHAIIADPDLRARFQKRLLSLGISPGLFGPAMVEAAYSPEGEVWLAQLLRYLDGNRHVFDAGIAEIPGLRTMPLQATYLAWVDCSGTGLTEAQLHARVYGQAKVAPDAGAIFGAGGEGWLRFNLATPRARIQEAVSRLKDAFADLQ